jgi:lysophospholipase L1-like esterase
MRTHTPEFFHCWSRLIAAATAVVCLSVPGRAQQPDRVRGVAGPGTAPAYLALGDSYPYGSDGSGYVPHNDNFWRGYPDFLSEILDRPLVNTACPGETAASFLTGDPLQSGPACLSVKSAGLLHVDYTGSQMDFVERYLATHQRVVLVTLQIGGNDFGNFIGQCRNRVSCIMGGLPGFEATLAANVGEILGRIRGAGYSGPIIFVEYPATNYSAMGASLQSDVYQAVAPTVTNYGAEMAPVFDRFHDAAQPYGGNACTAGLLVTNADGTCNVHPTRFGHQLITSIIAEMLPAGTWPER